MNSINLIGRLTADPELSKSKDDKDYCKFTVAVTRDKDNTDFIDAVAFARHAKVIAKYISKGDQIGIDGRLETSLYDDKDGIRRKSATVTVSNVYLIGNSKKSEK